MKNQTFQLKEILPNPFRRIENYPLLESKVEALAESIGATGFWENVVVRVNDDGKPELAYGHHRLEALRKQYPPAKEFDWIVRPLSDGEMIQMMARENGESYKTNPAVLRETIIAAVEAYGAGKIKPSEIPIAPRTDPNMRRSAPSFSTAPAGGAVDHAYTIEALAKFLGMMKTNGEVRDSFRAAFGAVELIKERYLKESQVEVLNSERLENLVAGVKKQRDAARTANELLAAKAVTPKEIRKVAKDKKDAAILTARIARLAADEARTIHPDNIRYRTQCIAEEEARKVGRKAAPRATPWSYPKPTAEEEAQQAAEHAEWRASCAAEDAERAAEDKAAADKRKDFSKDAKEIADAGRKALAIKYHPDKGGDSAERMIRINVAHQRLMRLIDQDDNPSWSSLLRRGQRTAA